MRFAKDFPDKLRSSILLSEVIGKKVALKQRGKEFQGLCPFHNEKSPSFTVSDQKGFYHCFGCAAHGDLIGFTMNSDGLDFKSAVLKLAADFGIEVPYVKSDEVMENKEARDYLILEKICQFFEKNLYEDAGSTARNYLRSRVIRASTAKNFRLGFAPNSYEKLINFLKSEGFSESEIAATGAISRNERGAYDKFRNRVIFPIADKKNRVIAFGGRVLGDELPKYLNSAETDLFKKNQTLYNFANARKAIFDKGYAVVVEGYFDVISLAAAGVENVVAGMGTALGAEHLKELFLITDKIVICLDGDAAGIRAAKKVCDIALPLISAKKNLAVTFLPGKMDPDDFVKEFGAAEIEKKFTDAAPLSQSLYEFALLDLGVKDRAKMTAEEKAKVENVLFKKADLINDAATKKYFIQFFKDLLFTAGRSFGKGKKPATVSTFLQNIVAKESKSKSSAADNLAKEIIAFIVAFPQLAQFREDGHDVKELHFANEKLDEIKSAIIDLIECNEVVDKTKIAELANEKNAAEIIAQIIEMATSLESRDLETNLVKFRILLLRDLLLHVEAQCKTLSETSEAETTDPSAITDEKIKEIFAYKHSLQKKILQLEQEII